MYIKKAYGYVMKETASPKSKTDFVKPKDNLYLNINKLYLYNNFKILREVLKEVLQSQNVIQKSTIKTLSLQVF